MEIGVRLPSSGRYASSENIVSVAQWAEELGYHSVWLGEHVILPERVDSFYPYASDNRWDVAADTNLLDPLLVLAWAGAAAPSIKLGTSVFVVPLRNPILLAKQVATLDFLSGGRVILGIGVGWMEEEFELIGAPFAKRGSRTVEMVELMRELWSGETVNFQGEYWQISGAKMHPTPGQPTIPIVWGGHSDYALKRVARLGDGWHPTQLTLEQLAQGKERLHQYCEQYGRDPDSVMIIARPGKIYQINAEILEKYRELGVHILVVDVPLTDRDLSGFRSEMQHIAEVGGLQLRG